MIESNKAAETPKPKGVQLRFATEDDFERFFPLGQELADEPCFSKYIAADAAHKINDTDPIDLTPLIPLITRRQWLESKGNLADLAV